MINNRPDSSNEMNRDDSFESKLDQMPLIIEEDRFENPPIVIRNMEGLIKIGEKEGGANGAGLLGGWYIDPNGKRLFIKQDVSMGIIRGIVADKINHAKNISEVIASRLMRLIDEENKDSIAEVNFIAPDAEIELPNEDGSQVYVVSVGMGAATTAPDEKNAENEEKKAEELDLDFYQLYDAYQRRFNNSLPSYEEVYKKLYGSTYIDLWEDAYLAYNFSPQFEALRLAKGSIEIPKFRPKNVGTLNQFPLINVIQSNRYEGLPGHVALRVFVDDPDQHSANYGARLIPGKPFKKKVGSIDFAGAMYKLDGSLHFRDILRYPPGFGPTNHAREYPEEIVICEEFANTNKKIGNFPSEKILAEIQLIMLELDALYGLSPLLETARRLGAPITNANIKPLVLHDISQHLYQCFVARQKAARALYYEVSLSLCFEKQNDEFFYTPDQLPFLEKLILNNSDYFSNLLKTGKMVKFHKADQKSDQAYDRLNHLLSKKIQSVIFGNKLLFRSSSTFHRVFNSGKIERLDEDFGFKYVMKSLIGYPNKGNPYNWLEFIGTGFGLVTFTKNVVKLVVEYLPEVTADFFGYVFESNKRYIAKAVDEKNSAITALAYISMAVSSLLYTVFKSIRLITMRATSPIESIKQAYRFGAKLHPAVGIILSGVSLAVSLAELLIVSILASPVISMMLASISSTVIGAKIMAGLSLLANSLLSIPFVSAAMGFVSTSATLIGLSIMKAAPTLAAFAALVVMPLRSLFKSSVKSAWRDRKVDVIVPLVFEETNDFSSNQQINQLLVEHSLSAPPSPKPYLQASEPNSPVDDAKESAVYQNVAENSARHDSALGDDFMAGLLNNGVFSNSADQPVAVPISHNPPTSEDKNDLTSSARFDPANN